MLETFGRPKSRESDGDHLGVEYALASHCQMLREAGLLRPEHCVLRHQPFPRGRVWEGVVIDDFSVISGEPASSNNHLSVSVQHLEQAEATYASEEVSGSDEKAVRGAEAFKVIGAEVLSDEKARGSNLVTVGAPLSKRIPMPCLSLKVASLPCVSRALACWKLGLCLYVQEAVLLCPL